MLFLTKSQIFSLYSVKAWLIEPHQKILAQAIIQKDNVSSKDFFEL